MVEDEQMDNEGYQRDVERGAALEMKSTTKGTNTGAKSNPGELSNNTTTTTTKKQLDITLATRGAEQTSEKNYPRLLGGNNYSTLPSTSCRPEICQAARRRYAPPDLSGSPWHRYKTIFLLLMLILLALWIVIYATLNSLKIL